MISANLSAIFYLISGVLFILALRGLSSPDTSRQGNYFGIAGMIIAIVVTFLSVGNFSTSLVYVIIILLIGGAIGAFIAFRIPMTAMPELVAGFHSLVGLAAVFVAIAAFLNPEAFNLGVVGGIKLASLIEMSIGAAVGAITFSGSIIAFLKLRGIMSGAPIIFSGQHILNLILGLGIFALIFYLCRTQATNIFWTIISGVTIWTIFESFYFWAASNDIVPIMFWYDNPFWYGIFFIIIPIWSSAHFYIIHRLLHYTFLYKTVHNLHHRNISPGPWSGISMHPIEHILYFSTVVIHFVVPSSPIHVLFHFYQQGLNPAFSHSGFDSIVIKEKKRLKAGDFFHQLHHRYFNCNYGTIEMPWDRFFGTFNDGTKK